MIISNEAYLSKKMSVIIKMPEKKIEKEFEFDSEFDITKIKTSAELDIKPKFEIDGLGLDFAKDVIVKGTYYEIDIPKEKAISGKTRVKALNLIHNGIEHQFIAESESFRYQIDVIRYQKKLNLDEIDGLKLKIWKTRQDLKTDRFTGKADVYNLKAL